MRLRDMPRDRETEAQSAMRAGGAGITLSESFEDVGLQLQGNSTPRVGDFENRLVAVVCEPDRDVTTRRRELHGVREQVPRHLLDALGVTPGGGRVGKIVSKRQPLHDGRRPDALDRG